ncbi:hypothetical protein NT6N_13810 [Oceaniferula spumae]|uniref:Uncharacterized protein n=1 Tax=Oceaniferula spumae TaxID=2979115 RepID=A0AAT9FK60_9BACT
MNPLNSSRPIALAALAILSFINSPDALADDLSGDVKVIKEAGAPKVLRCVLNGRPRALAIELSGQVAVAYDTWHGGIFTIWEPAASGQFVKLDGAVYTGRHGPQPSTNGKAIFTDKDPADTQRYHFSDKNASLHYLGHKVGENGIVTLSFAFRDADGKQIALIEDSSAAGDNNTLHRQLNVSGLADGQNVTIDFPKGLSWSGVENDRVTITSNSKSTFTAKLP